MEIKKWILDLKVGDNFVVREPHGKGLRLYTVTGITKAQIIAGRVRFWKLKNGRMVGSTGWCIPYMGEFDDEARLDLLRQKVVNMAHKINYNEIKYDQIKRIYDSLIDIYRRQAQEKFSNGE